MTTPALSIVGGRYALGEVLAIGGMSTVHRAEDLESGRPVALKVFRISADPMAAERLRREGELLAQLAHPHLVRAFDAGVDTDGSGAWLALELVTGPNVAAALHAGGPMSLEDARRLLDDLAGALEHIHARGIVHRDVKPANVLLTADPREDRDWRAKLADFGVATRGQVGAALVGEIAVGTAAYFSPEQTRGEPVSAASDIYSLGLVALEALTGERAFPGGAVESATARLFRRPPVPGWLDDGWRALLETMTAPDPAGRPTAAQVRAASARLVTASADRGRARRTVAADPEAHTEPATLLALSVAASPASPAGPSPHRFPRRRMRFAMPAGALDRLARRALVVSSAGVLLAGTAAGGTALMAAAPAEPIIPLADQLPTAPAVVAHAPKTAPRPAATGRPAVPHRVVRATPARPKAEAPAPRVHHVHLTVKPAVPQHPMVRPPAPNPLAKEHPRPVDRFRKAPKTHAVPAKGHFPAPRAAKHQKRGEHR